MSYLPASASPAAARGRSTPRRTSGRPRLVPPRAGADAAPSAPMGSPVAVPGGSCSGSPAPATSTQPTARSCMAQGPRWSASRVIACRAEGWGIRGPARGRHRATPWKSQDGLGQPWGLCQAYPNGGWPHASVRQALAESVPTKGHGSAQGWRPCTPAMAAGLTDHGWSLRAGLLYRVPPWPQPQMVSERQRFEPREERSRRVRRGSPTGMERGWKTHDKYGSPADACYAARLAKVPKH